MIRRKQLAQVSAKKRADLTVYELARQKAYDRDKGRCQAAGRFGTACWGRPEVHHLLPRSRGPEVRNTVSNLVTLCAGCHEQAHLHPLLAKEMGFLK